MRLAMQAEPRYRVAPMISWCIVGDGRAQVSCSLCKYGVTFVKPGTSSVFKHCNGEREAIPDAIIEKLHQRGQVLRQVAAALADS